MRVSDAGEGKMGTFSFVQPPENGNYFLSLAKRLLLPVPAIGQPVKYEGQVKLLPRGQCFEKKYEKVIADMVRTMRTWLFLAQLPDLSNCDPDDLRLGAG